MKSFTDNHWNDRAIQCKDFSAVNIPDVQQKALERDIICRYLKPNMHILEVGCGNGDSTFVYRQNVRHVDAFDFSPNMIKRAKEVVGEKNNTFFEDNILDPQHLGNDYDAVICQRVLINLGNFENQVVAVKQMASVVKHGGLLILAEGYANGFEKLSAIRKAVGLDALKPAAINFYSRYEELAPCLNEYFTYVDSIYLGSYDYLTRIVYPLIATGDVDHNTQYHELFSVLSKAFNPEAFNTLSRLRIDVLLRR